MRAKKRFGDIPDLRPIHSFMAPVVLRPLSRSLEAKGLAGPDALLDNQALVQYCHMGDACHETLCTERCRLNRYVQYTVIRLWTSCIYIRAVM